MKAVPVPASSLDAYLPLLSWHFDSFCRAGDWTPDDLVDGIRNGTRQLWLAWDDGPKAAVLTQVGDDRLRTCTLTHAAGEDHEKWVHLISVIEDWARAEGCRNLEFFARPGWARVMKDMKRTHIVLEKRL